MSSTSVSERSPRLSYREKRAARAELLALLEERERRQRERAETLDRFVPRVSPEFESPRHLAPLLDLFERIARGEMVRACVSVPPQHGKTETLLHGLAWLLRRDPSQSYAFATYQQDQSNDKSDRARTLTKRAGVSISPTRANLLQWRTTAGGGCLFTSVGGPLTGQNARAIVFDDPFKNRDAALSEATRRAVWSFFQSAVMTRGQEGMSVVVVHTRWVEDDLIGRLATKGWEVVNLPFLMREDGSPATRDGGYADAVRVLNPRDESGFGWTLDGARKHLVELDEAVAEALYQGRPRRRVDGALWSWERIESARVDRAPDMRRVVVAIDPAVTAGEGSDETGIVVAGLGYDGRGYVLADASGRYTPDGWARKAVALYREHRADRIVAEVNNGGALVEHTLRTVDRSIPMRAVHASRGKAIRAEPVSALYEQGRVSHVGSLDALEEQLTTWDPATSGKSPDRLDALVWALTELMVDAPQPRHATSSHYDF